MIHVSKCLKGAAGKCHYLDIPGKYFPGKYSKQRSVAWYVFMSTPRRSTMLITQKHPVTLKKGACFKASDIRDIIEYTSSLYKRQ